MSKKPFKPITMADVNKLFTKDEMAEFAAGARLGFGAGSEKETPDTPEEKPEALPIRKRKR